MTLERRQREKVAQQVKTGSRLSSVLLDGTTTSDIITFGTVMEKVTFQADGDVAGTIEFSVDGKSWDDSTALGASGVMVSYNTHNVTAVRVVRSSGSGRVHLAAK
jgi:hypothetical protein